MAKADEVLSSAVWVLLDDSCIVISLVRLFEVGVHILVTYCN